MTVIDQLKNFTKKMQNRVGSLQDNISIQSDAKLDIENLTLSDLSVALKFIDEKIDELEEIQRNEDAIVLTGLIKKAVEAPYPTETRLILNCQIIIDSKYEVEDVEDNLRRGYCPEVGAKHNVSVKMEDEEYAYLEEDIAHDLQHYINCNNIIGCSDVLKQMEETENLWANVSEKVTDYLGDYNVDKLYGADDNDDLLLTAEEIGEKLIEADEPTTLEIKPIKDYLYIDGCWPFREWDPCKFTINEMTFNSLAQYVLAEQARYFEDREGLEIIMRDAHKFKGKQVRGFREEVWQGVAGDVVSKAYENLFLQTPGALRVFMDTGDKILVNASQDKFWGIGINRYDDSNGVEWTGQNMLGSVLMRLRYKLRANPSVVKMYETTQELYR